MDKRKSWKRLGVTLIIIAAAAGAFAWNLIQKPALPEGFAFGNGRLEATEVDITTKYGGRLAHMAVDEGDSVEIDQVLAQMDTKELEAQLKRSQAEVSRARQERSFAEAVITQRKSELLLAKKDLERAKGLYESDSISLEELQRDETAVQTAMATLAASEARLSTADAAIEAAIANTDLVKVQIDDSALKAPINGRVLYRLAEPGEVLPAGGKLLTVLDPTDVYMTIFLPTQYAARVEVGAQARIVLDGMPEQAIPASVSFIAPRAQFTPKEVETRTEREKLMFRTKIKLDPALLKLHKGWAKTGVTGVAYVRLNQEAEWPENLPEMEPQ
jgi:HlyD family secretion protein